MNDTNKRAALSEVVIATTLTAIGFFTGQGPLMSLASIGAGIGGNWGASLVENSYRNWSQEWFGRNGVLDDDISQALMQALQKAVKELEPELKKHQLYKRLQHHNRKEADSLLANLAAIGDDANLIVQNQPAMPQDMTSLMMGDQSQLETQLGQIIKRRFSGYSSDFVDLTKLIRKRLTERWLHHFQRILNEPTEVGTKARVACQRLWQQSLIQALNEIGQNTTETKEILDWLKASAERQELQLGEINPSLDIFVQALENVLEQRLSKIEHNTSATLANTDEITLNTNEIRTETGEIKDGISTLQEQLKQLIKADTEENMKTRGMIIPKTRRDSTDVLQAPTQQKKHERKVVHPMNQFEKLRDQLDYLVDTEFRDMMRSLLPIREQTSLPMPLHSIDRGTFLGQMQTYRRLRQVEIYLCQNYPARFSC